MSPGLVTRLSGIADEASPSLAQQLKCHSILGWRNIELRSVNGKQISALQRAELQAVAASIRHSGLSVSCLCSPIAGWSRSADFPIEKELQEIDRLAILGNEIQCKYIRIMSYNENCIDGSRKQLIFDRIKRIVGHASDRSMIILHENCTGWGGQNAENTLKLIDAVDSDQFGILFDTGNGGAHNYNSAEFLSAIIPYVRHVHIKDYTFTSRGNEENIAYTFPGNGSGTVFKCIRMLEHAGYSGHYSIEPHINSIPHLCIGKKERSIDPTYTEYAKRFQRDMESIIVNR